jgi:uncharacterized protein (DUF362 family)
MKKIPSDLTRRKFLRLLAASGAGALLAACGADKVLTPDAAPATSTPRDAPPTWTPTQPATEAAEAQATEPSAADSNATPTREPTPVPTANQTYLAVARGDDPRAITRAAIAAIGGMARFVKSGDEVVLKPNICTDYQTYEYGATTNPQVIAALVELCLGAGTKRVKVMDNPFGGTAESAYARSGIAEAVRAAGGEMVIMHRAKFKGTAIPEGRSIQTWPVYQEILNADVLIDVPIAKHHGSTRLSLASKNLIGVVQNPGGLHADLHQRIADLVSLVRPTLTVVDAVRTLMRNGPTGGNLDDVKIQNTVIASHDIIAADAYATTLFDLQPADIGYVRLGADMGLGTLDLGGIAIEELTV